ncbi:MAG: lamin tail domain-containing protein [bacterium]
MLKYAGRGLWPLLGLLLAASGCVAAPAAPTPSPRAGVVFINEFMASNSATVADPHGEYDDWVELYNAGETDVRLGAFSLTDDLTVPMKWPFPDTVLPAGGYLLIWADGQPEQGQLHATFKLNAERGEQLGLYETDGDDIFFVDTLSFGPQRTDTSRGRLPDGDSRWQFLPYPTPGRPNSSGISPLRGRLFLNELLAANRSVIADPFGSYDDWVELYNAGDEPVPLLGVYLTDDLRTPTKWAFPDTALAPGGYLLVWADGEEYQGPLHVSFRLNAEQGERLGLFAADSFQVLLVDTVSFGPQRPDTSWGRLPDAGPAWQAMPRPTPRGPNTGR